MTKEYQEGFRCGRQTAEDSHKGRINAKERSIRILSPYNKYVEPKKDADWRRGRLDGCEEYNDSVPHIDVYI